MSRNNQSLNSIFLSEAKNAASQKMFMITIIKQCDVNNVNINNAVKACDNSYLAFFGRPSLQIFVISFLWPDYADVLICG